MCDEDSLNLQNILQSVPRRELKIILERAEHIFPALKDGLVSVCVCAHRKKRWKCVFPENYIWENYATKLIFLLICTT
jgi:hypothetical protein